MSQRRVFRHAALPDSSLVAMSRLIVRSEQFVNNLLPNTR